MRETIIHASKRSAWPGAMVVPSDNFMTVEEPPCMLITPCAPLLGEVHLVLPSLSITWLR